jgi:hypothetical protein
MLYLSSPSATAGFIQRLLGLDPVLERERLGDELHQLLQELVEHARQGTAQPLLSLSIAPIFDSVRRHRSRTHIGQRRKFRRAYGA